MPVPVGKGTGTLQPGSTTGSVWDWLPGYSELQAVKAFIGEISDWHMWASLGWIALGLALAALGLNLWLGLSQKVTGAMNSIRSTAAQAA